VLAIRKFELHVDILPYFSYKLWRLKLLSLYSYSYSKLYEFFNVWAI